MLALLRLANMVGVAEVQKGHLVALENTVSALGSTVVHALVGSTRGAQPKRIDIQNQTHSPCQAISLHMCAARRVLASNQAGSINVHSLALHFFHSHLLLWLDL